MQIFPSQPFERDAPGTLSDASREKEAFELALKKYHGRIFQLAYHYLNNYEDADDVTQETFVRAWKNWDSFRGDANVYTWLYRIALNLCHNHRKSAQRKKRHESHSLDASSGTDEEAAQTSDIPDLSEIPWQDLERKELGSVLHKALLNLPENYRTVIVLCDIEGLKYEEIAQVTGSSLKAIKSRLFRARNMLRRNLAAYLAKS